jgi:hypothetical protein
MRYVPPKHLTLSELHGVTTQKTVILRDFSLLHSVQTGSGSHPASYPIGAGAVPLGIERSERETCHSSPSGIKIRNACSCYVHYSICFHGVVRKLAQRKCYCLKSDGFPDPVLFS